MTSVGGKNLRLSSISPVWWLYALVTFGLFGLLFFVWFWQDSPAYNPPPKPRVVYNSGCLKINSNELECRVNLEVADDDQKRIKGLSGREKMPDNAGMLFISDVVETQCFWMKDMKFPLDIIWLDAQKKVTKIIENLSPETYPGQFCSDAPDKYVIELSAGSVDRLGISEGKTLYY